MQGLRPAPARLPPRLAFDSSDSAWGAISGAVIASVCVSACMLARLEHADISRTLACNLKAIRYFRRNIGLTVRWKQKRAAPKLCNAAFQCNAFIAMQGLISARTKTSTAAMSFMDAP